MYLRQYYLRDVFSPSFSTTFFNLLSYQRVPGSCVRLISAAQEYRAHNLGFWYFGIFYPFFGITSAITPCFVGGILSL